ncbi:hypothetical protein K0M31_009932 [Melipona bicolor]|uniref:Uncharacterized protein n=1 Tax=Melipona bicolor TaxID=60889 RepID=A0AA40FNS2_9HYME|nr:hypothetical protein K0M31_009932 [Melipona bicolor]
MNKGVGPIAGACSRFSCVSVGLPLAGSVGLCRTVAGPGASQSEHSIQQQRYQRQPNGKRLPGKSVAGLSVCLCVRVDHACASAAWVCAEVAYLAASNTQ